MQQFCIAARGMRGQKLFIRPIEPADRDAVSRFLRQETAGSIVPACGLLGKLVGELVAVLAMQITADAIQIDDVVVAADLRRKRIGRLMLDEAEQIAAKMDRTRLIVTAPHEFFRRTGFAREGERWIRQVRSHGAERASR
jgi:GNAT superfamily N-acetyltransferase